MSIKKSAAKKTNNSKPFLYGYSAELEKTSNILELRTHIHQLIRRLNLSEYIYMHINNTNTPLFILNTLPKTLIAHYYTSECYQHDMNIERAKYNAHHYFSSSTYDYIASAPFSDQTTHCMHIIQQLYSSFDYFDFYNIPIKRQKEAGHALLSVAHRGMPRTDFQSTISNCKSTLSLLCEAIEEVVTFKFNDQFGCINFHNHNRHALSTKPRQLLQLLANEDCTIYDIAKRLGINIVTANQHLKTARRCLGVRTNYAAIKIAIQEQLISYTNEPHILKPMKNWL